MTDMINEITVNNNTEYYWTFDCDGYFLGGVDTLEDAEAFVRETGGYYEVAHNN